MEMEGKQRNIRDRRMKMQIEAASAAAAEMDNGETDDGVKKKKAVVGGSVDAGEMGSSGSKRRLSPVGSSGSPAARCCQAENCTADLKVSKQYHRRHRVCEYHAKAAAVTVGGVRQRFCQQCSRFHELLEFDETKRSCRRRLAGHNERRRKSSSGESNSDGSGGQVSRLGCGEVDDSGKIHIAIPQDNAANHKHFNI